LANYIIVVLRKEKLNYKKKEEEKLTKVLVLCRWLPESIGNAFWDRHIDDDGGVTVGVLVSKQRQAVSGCTVSVPVRVAAIASPSVTATQAGGRQAFPRTSGR